MKNKALLTETLIRREERRVEGVSYTYEISMREGANLNGIKAPLYSLSIRMTDSRGNSTTARSKQPFADAGHALLFFDKLVRTLATPIDLAYVVEDEIR